MALPAPSASAFPGPAVRRAALLATSALAGVLWAAAATAEPAANALPNGGVVSAGQSTITANGAAMTITQGTDRSAINWNGYNVGANASVTYIQPGAGSISLNRVVGNDPSQIFGRLTANGQVWLSNPNGILFGRSARIDVAGLVAATSNITDNEFMTGTGRFRFDQAGRPDAAIINEGQITIRDAGLAAFVAPGVRNSGVINARLGRVALGGGNTFTLDLYGDQLINLALNDPATQNAVGADGSVVEAGVTNTATGRIMADGGRVQLTANVARGVVDNIIRTAGEIVTRAVVDRNGDIVLDGGSAGGVEVTGTLDASGRDAGQRGGRVRVTGERIRIAPTVTVDVSGDVGGGAIEIGGGMRGTGPLAHARSTAVEAGARLIADALTGGRGGTVVVWSDGDTAFAGSASARGGAATGDGGTVETSGPVLSIGTSATVATLAPNGTRGQWLLDPTVLNVNAAPSGGDAAIVGGANSPGGAATIQAATIEAALATTDVTLMATTQINWNAGASIIYDAAAARALTFAAPTVALFGPITTSADLHGLTITGIGTTTVDVHDGARINDAVRIVAPGASAAAQNVVNVYPGSYSEGVLNVVDPVAGFQNLGLDVFKDNIIVRGVDAGGAPVASRDATLATITALYQAGFGAEHLVSGSNVTIAGVTLRPAADGDNKTLEVIGNNFVLRDSVVDLRGNANAPDAVYIDDFFPAPDNTHAFPHITQFRLENNRFITDQPDERMLVVGLGVGLIDATHASPITDRVIDGNELIGAGGTYSAGIQIAGVIPGVAWAQAEAGPVTITNNSFDGFERIIRTVGTLTSDLPWNDVFHNNGNNFNVGGNGGAVLTFVGDTTQARAVMLDAGSSLYPEIMITRTIQRSVDRALPGDTVEALAGVYRENVTIATDGVALVGPRRGQDPTALDLAAATSTLTNAVIDAGHQDAPGVSIQASGVSVDGFTIVDSAQAGILVGPGAGEGSTGSTSVIADNTIQGNVDGIRIEDALRSGGTTIIANNAIGAGSDGILLTDSAAAATANVVIRGNTVRFGQDGSGGIGIGVITRAPEGDQPAAAATGTLAVSFGPGNQVIGTGTGFASPFATPASPSFETGLLFDGPNSAIVGDTLDSMAFGQINGNYITFINHALYAPGLPTVIDASHVSFDGFAVGSVPPSASRNALIAALNARVTDFTDRGAGPALTDPTFVGLLFFGDIFVQAVPPAQAPIPGASPQSADPAFAGPSAGTFDRIGVDGPFAFSAEPFAANRSLGGSPASGAADVQALQNIAPAAPQDLDAANPAADYGGATQCTTLSAEALANELLDRFTFGNVTHRADQCVPTVFAE
jgi:filamentous hemagglutinin family protein